MMEKRGEGRQERIVEPDLPVIDAHHHLIDHHGVRYMFEEFLEDVNAGHNIVASVYVESRSFARPYGPAHLRPAGEIEFANGVAAMSASGDYGKCRVNAAIVGHADLSAGAIVAEALDLAMQLAPDRFRGIRQVALWDEKEEVMKMVSARPPRHLMASAGFIEGFKELAKRKLTFDAICFHHQLEEVEALAEMFPHTTIILNHMGFALGKSESESAKAEIFRQWRSRLHELARHENVVCKVGGLGMPFWGFGFEERPDPISSDELADRWRPYIEAAIDAFGVARCMMESNFPADGRSCGYVPTWNALKKVVSSCSPDEKKKLFFDVAKKAYSIET